MAKSEQKRQQKLARKQAKDRKRHQQEVMRRQQVASLYGQMLASAGGKLAFCGIGDMSQGLGHVGLARQVSVGYWACCLLLVDSYCMGVKNVMAGFWPEDTRKRAFQNLQPASPEVARGLVESSIEFAARAGFKPHGDYAKVAPLWGDIPRGTIEGIYELGLKGKHFYVAGPHDDEVRQRFILTMLEKNLGADNYNTLFGAAISDDYSTPEDLIEQFEDDNGEMMDSLEYIRVDPGDKQ